MGLRVPTHNFHKNEGAALVEYVVLFALLSVMVLMALPKLGTSSSEKFEKAAEEMHCGFTGSGGGVVVKKYCGNPKDEGSKSGFMK